MTDEQYAQLIEKAARKRWQEIKSAETIEWDEFPPEAQLSQIDAMKAAIDIIEPIIRADEREACAKVIEQRAIERHGYDKHADAAAIREGR